MKSVHNRCVIELFVALLVLSLCPFDNSRTFVIAHRPSFVWPSSFVCPSSVNGFVNVSHFHLLLQNRLMDLMKLGPFDNTAFAVSGKVGRP